MVHRSSRHRRSADLLVSGDAVLRCCCCCWWWQWSRRWCRWCGFVNHASETDAKPEKPDKTGQSTHFRENGIIYIQWELCNASSAAEVVFNSEISAIQSPIAHGILCSDWAVYGQEFYDRPAVRKSWCLQDGSGIAEEEVRRVLEVEEGVSPRVQCQHQQRYGQDVEDDASDHLRTHVYTSRKFILWINIAL